MSPQPGSYVTRNVRLIEPLGEGGMGSVWSADHLGLDTKVAVKFVSTKRSLEDEVVVARFEREARAAAKIRSDYVVRTHDHGISDDGVPYIVMELLEGETLRQHLVRRERLALSEVVRVVEQIARGLSAAHKLDVVHRDVKPDNVFMTTIDEALRVKILDFGIAKHIAEGEASVTQTGSLVGSPQYMSPEQLLKPKTADARTDVWSLGVVAYELITGVPPFSGDTVTALSMAICNGHHKPPSQHVSELPSSVDAWFLRALAVSPEERLGSARELATTLREAVGDAVVPGPTKLASEPTPVDETAETVDADKVTFDGSVESLSRPPPPSASRARQGAFIIAGLVAAGATWLLSREAPIELRSSLSSAPPTLRVSAQPTAVPVVPPEGMVMIDAGDYRVGCDGDSGACFGDDQPVHRVRLLRFAIDQHEVSVADYRRCTAAGACPPPGDDAGCNAGDKARRDHPINCVGWAAARAYCAFVERRLPTEIEWEVAARGGEDRAFPWGDEPADCSRAVVACGNGGTQPVGSRESDRSRHGAWDMAGNVREWTTSDYLPYPGGKIRDRQTGKVNRGGSYAMSAENANRSFTRQVDDPTEARADLGLRCALSL